MPYRALLDSKHKVTALDQARRLVQSASELILKAEKLAEEARAEGVPREIWSTPLDALYTEAEEAMGAAITALVNTNWDYKDVLAAERLKGFSGGKFAVKGRYLCDLSDSSCFYYMFEDQDIVKLQNFDTTEYNRSARVSRITEGDQRIASVQEDGDILDTWNVIDGWVLEPPNLTAEEAIGDSTSALKAGAITGGLVEPGKHYILRFYVQPNIANTGYLQIGFLHEDLSIKWVYDGSEETSPLVANVEKTILFQLTEQLDVAGVSPTGVLYLCHSNFVGSVSNISILPVGVLELDFYGGGEALIERTKGSVTLERRMYAD